MRQVDGKIWGFTLIEIMIGIAVLAILLALAVPSFTQIIRNNRAAAQANNFVLALTVARNEAVTRGMPVSICAADAAGTACAGAVSDWQNGWLIFLDATGAAGAIDGTDNVLHSVQRVSDGMQLTASNNVGFIRYSRSGTPTNTGGVAAGTAVVTFGVQHQYCTGANRRAIAIDRTGRSNLVKVACA